MFRAKKPVKSVFFLDPDDEAHEVSVAFSEEPSVLELALENAIKLSHSCGGMGTCGTCRIEVLSPLADLEARNETEKEMAEDRGFAAHERLACQTLAKNGLRIRIP